MTNLIARTRRPDITFCRSGRINIAARVARVLCLKKGDTINIANFNGEFLLFAIQHPPGRHYAQCFPSKNGSLNFCANSVTLARAILNEARVSASSASFFVGHPIDIEGTLYLPIITKNPIIRH